MNARQPIPILPAEAEPAAVAPAAGAATGAADASGLSCHGGRDQMLEAARKAGKTDTLERYAADYPKGPHDQPQSMCPAFGSLRVGCACDAPTPSCRARPAACTA